VSTQSGQLYVVATPIGNLSDISERARSVLQDVALIAAEDKRHSAKLLRHLGINSPLLALHDHNEHAVVEQLVARLQVGEDVALISDAGTPLVSDPGYILVRKAHDAGIPVHPVPGACAAIAALSASGLATDRFLFCGFLPAKQAARRNQLEQLADHTETLIFYEAPHRILACLEDMRQVIGEEREAVLARELTKQFETIRRGSLAALHSWVEQDSNQQRGEMVLLLAGQPQDAHTETAQSEKLLKLLVDAMPLKQAVDITVSTFGGKKNAIYQKALQLKGNNER